LKVCAKRNTGIKEFADKVLSTQDRIKIEEYSSELGFICPEKINVNKLLKVNIKRAGGLIILMRKNLDHRKHIRASGRREGQQRIF